MDYDYQEKGNPIGVLVAVFAGLITLVLVVVIGLVIAGTAYQQNYSTINSLTDTNAKNAITSAIQNSFTAVSTSSTYIVILVLAVVGGLALMYIMGFGNAAGAGNKGGGAL
jgi:ABC-type Fe3+ transport system permease subunit